MQSFFIPEVSKRVAARTPHKIEFAEAYGGSMVKVSGTFNQKAYPKDTEELRRRGAIVRKLPEKVSVDRANALSAWPAQKAKELDGLGLPGTQVLDLALKAAEDLGYRWPVRYKTK